jgi:hypothetical protein
VALFDILSQNLPRVTEKDHEETRSRIGSRSAVNTAVILDRLILLDHVGSSIM